LLARWWLAVILDKCLLLTNLVMHTRRKNMRGVVYNYSGQLDHITAFLRTVLLRGVHKLTLWNTTKIYNNLHKENHLSLQNMCWFHYLHLVLFKSWVVLLFQVTFDCNIQIRSFSLVLVKADYIACRPINLHLCFTWAFWSLVRYAL